MVAVTGVISLPEQAVTLGKEREAVGCGVTVMVPLAEVEPQLGVKLLVTVMVYWPLLLGVPERRPLSALKVIPNRLEPLTEPPAKVAVMLLIAVPEQTVWSWLLERVTDGSGFTVTVAVAVVVQPLEVDPTTV